MSAVRTIRVEASAPYDVRFERRGSLLQVGEAVQALGVREAVVVTDDTVRALYGQTVADSLGRAGVRAQCFSFAPGEDSKSLATYGALMEFLAESQLTRAGAVVAVGGGVVGDLAGFAAATYLRGVRFVQVPTTLLAVVDSSVGGKTAVNLAAGKNLAGAFYQPSLVVVDMGTLHTLPPEEVANGLSEMVKYGAIADETLFAQMASGGYDEARAARCVEIKADFVRQDEHDGGARQALNFGHTIGHAIERASNFLISHGRAVAIGMALVARASAKMGWCSADTANAIVDALRANHLPTACSYEAEELAEHALHDKKRRGDSLTLVTAPRIGAYELRALPVAQLADFIRMGDERAWT